MPEVGPPVGGVLETALYVEDLTRSREFYQRVFGFATLFADERLCALNVADRQVLLLFKRGTSTQSMPTSGGTILPSKITGFPNLNNPNPTNTPAAPAKNLPYQRRNPSPFASLFGSALVEFSMTIARPPAGPAQL